MKLSRLVAAACLLAPTPLWAATTFISPVQTYSCSAGTFASALASATGITTCSGITNYNQLPNINGGTVLANTGTSSSTPAGTTQPILGVPSGSSGSLGFANSTVANTVTVQQVGATASYNFNLPNTVGSAGQALVSEGGGSTAMQWANILSSSFTISSKTSGYSVVSGTDDWKRFDNAGASGSVTFTLPSSPAAGDNNCYTVAAAQTLEVLANTGQSITMGNTTGSSAGNLQSSTVGSSVCIYYESTTAIYVWTSNGNWSLT